MKKIFKTRQLEIHGNKSEVTIKNKREYDTLPLSQLLYHVTLQTIRSDVNVSYVYYTLEIDI